MEAFETYRDRKIDFLGIDVLDEWQIKVYTITVNETFRSKEILKTVRGNLREVFLAETNLNELPVYRHAFIIIHEAREGVWILFSWWTGGEMLESIVRFAAYGNPGVIDSSPYSDSGFLICTWELEVYTHERKAWIAHVLKKVDNPDFEGYRQDGLSVC